MDKPLRILVVVNLPWDDRLGAVRIWMQLAKQWAKAGHTVEKFCLSDAFPNPTSSAARYAWRQAIFPYRAARFVRSYARKFDVVDCLIGTLPFPKRSLRFEGLLVGRSIGLYLTYADFIRSSRQRWQGQRRGKFLGRLLYTFTSWLLKRCADRALAHCDWFNLPNEDEKRALDERCPGAKIIVEPYGLSDAERAAFLKATQPALARLAHKEICFLGMWSVRKGSRDWPEIVRAIWNSAPDARFAFLGTMADEKTVLYDLGISPRESIRCVRTYDPKDLPQLVAGCAVGLFPSYIEGFGISVIEQLAAGIPTIAYDVPGPRQIFASARSEFLVASGNATAMAERAVKILQMNESEYASLSETSRRIANAFRWEKIAADTIDQYAAALAEVRSLNQRDETEAASA
jgi:glycosyltransferase involved in cell wall biosynthesis